MTLRAIACSVLLGLAGFSSAAELSYTYTGNFFDNNAITAEPSRLIAHVTFDFENSPQAADHIYAIKHWDVSAAGMYFTSATQSHLFNAAFIFDDQQNVVDWRISDARTDTDWSGFSTASAGLSFTGKAEDLAASYVVAGPYATIVNNPGAWTVSVVPEPAMYWSLLLGLAVVVSVQRRTPRRQGAATPL